MNDRQKFVITAALSYVMGQVNDLNEAFSDSEDHWIKKLIKVQGGMGSFVSEEEIADLIAIMTKKDETTET